MRCILGAMVQSGQESLTSRLRAAGRAFQAEEGRSFLYRSLKYILAAALLLFVADAAFHVGAVAIGFDKRVWLGGAGGVFLGVVSGRIQAKQARTCCPPGRDFGAVAGIESHQYPSA
jgi:hypothetical protein